MTMVMFLIFCISWLALVVNAQPVSKLDPEFSTAQPGVSAPLLVLVISGAAATVSVLGISLALFVNRFMNRTLQRRNAWELMPRTEQQRIIDMQISDSNIIITPTKSTPVEETDLPKPLVDLEDLVEEESLLLFSDEDPGSPHDSLASLDDGPDSPTLITFNDPTVVVVCVPKSLITYDDPPVVNIIAADDNNEEEIFEDAVELIDFHDAVSSQNTPAPSPAPILEFMLWDADEESDEEFPDPPVPAIFLTSSLSPASAPAYTPKPSSALLPLPLPHTPRRPLQMREVKASGSPVIRPAWCIRADEDSSFAISTSSVSPAASPLIPRLLLLPAPSPPPSPTSIETQSLPPPLSETPTLSPDSLSPPSPDSPLDDTSPILSIALPTKASRSTTPAQPRTRYAYRSPVPELDLALAMQLRPGLGIGADPAWMVRFLMATLGWLAVLMTGGKGSGMGLDIHRRRIGMSS